MNKSFVFTARFPTGKKSHAKLALEKGKVGATWKQKWTFNSIWRGKAEKKEKERTTLWQPIDKTEKTNV